MYYPCKCKIFNALQELISHLGGVGSEVQIFSPRQRLKSLDY